MMMRNSSCSFARGRSFGAKPTTAVRKLAVTCKAQQQDVLLRRWVVALAAAVCVACGKVALSVQQLARDRRQNASFILGTRF